MTAREIRLMLLGVGVMFVFAAVLTNDSEPLIVAGLWIISALVWHLVDAAKEMRDKY